MSYRSQWTISEPNDIQTALGRVSWELKKQQNGFLTLTRRRRDVIGMAFGAVGEASLSVLGHAKACAEAISKEAMSEGDVDAVTKDTGYGRVLG